MVKPFIQAQHVRSNLPTIGMASSSTTLAPTPNPTQNLCLWASSSTPSTQNVMVNISLKISKGKRVYFSNKLDVSIILDIDPSTTTMSHFDSPDLVSHIDSPPFYLPNDFSMDQEEVSFFMTTQTQCILCIKPQEKT